MKRSYFDTSNENQNISMTETQRAVVDFIAFEDETSSVYPFAVTFDDLTMDMVDSIVNLCDGNTDTGFLYFVCEKVLGINPEIQ